MENTIGCQALRQKILAMELQTRLAILRDPPAKKRVELEAQLELLRQILDSQEWAS
jgi:hypothetical protein